VSLDNKYRLEVLENCVKWCERDEGKFFWRWVRQELDRVTQGSERFIGAWEQDKIIKANKMLARKEEAEYIYTFLERLKIIIDEKKKSGEDLTSIEEL